MAVKNTNIIINGSTVIPVKLDKATTGGAKDVTFGKATPEGVALPSGSQRYLDEATGAIYLPAECLSHYEGHLIDKDDLDAINAECKIDDLELNSVPVSSIPWHFAKGTYYLYPDPKSSDAIKGIFHGFLAAAKKDGNCFLTKWTPRSRQSLLAITLDGDTAVAVEIAFAGDVRAATPDQTEFTSQKPDKTLVESARKLLTATADPDLYATLADEAVDKRRKLVEQVVSGEKVVSAKPARKAAASTAAVDSVIADLEAALAAKTK